MSDSGDSNTITYEGQNEIQTKMDSLREDIRKGCVCILLRSLMLDGGCIDILILI